MRIPKEDLENKIQVPKTLSVLRNITGTKDTQSKLQNPTISEANEVLKSLDKKSRVYKFLQDEIKSQLTPEVKPAETETVVLAMPSMSEVRDSLDKLNETVSGMVFPEPLSQVDIGNFPEQKDIIIPEFPKTVKIDNFPKFPKFPKSINIGNLPKDLDLAPVIDTLQKGNEALLEGLQGLTDTMWSDEATRGVHILDKNGNIIDDFSPRVTVTSGGGGGSGTRIPRTIRSGSTTVTTAGTRVQLDTEVDTALKVDIQSPKTNTGSIYVGDGTIDSTKGIALEPGDVYAFDMTSPDSIYLDAEVNGEGLTWNIYA